MKKNLNTRSTTFLLFLFLLSFGFGLIGSKGFSNVFIITEADTQMMEKDLTPIKQLIEKKEYNSAIAKTNELIKLYAQAQPGTKEYLYLISSKGILGIIYQAKGDFERAVPIYEEVHNLLSQESTLYFENGLPIKQHLQLIYVQARGECYEKLGKYKEAKSLYESFNSFLNAEQTRLKGMQNPPPNYLHRVTYGITKLKSNIERCDKKIQDKPNK